MPKTGIMMFHKLLPVLVALFPAFVISDLELDPEDVPQQCQSICEPVTNLTSTCDADDRMDDRIENLLERQCICTNDSFDVANRTALCASCIDQNTNNGTQADGELTRPLWQMRVTRANADDQISTVS